MSYGLNVELVRCHFFHILLARKKARLHLFNGRSLQSHFAKDMIIEKNGTFGPFL